MTTSREKVGDVLELKRSRAGKFEDGTPRYKYTGRVRVDREPLPKVRRS